MRTTGPFASVLRSGLVAVLVVAAAVVFVINPLTPPRTRSAAPTVSAPTDAGEVARLIEACGRDGRPRRGEWLQGSAPWLRLAELGPHAAPALPLLVQRLRATGLLYGVERDTLVGLGAPALAALVGVILDPNVGPRTVEASVAMICDLEDDALGALDGLPGFPDGLRADVVAWVRQPGRLHRAPRDALERLAPFVSDPVPVGPAGRFGALASDPFAYPSSSQVVPADPFPRAAAALQLPSVPAPLGPRRQRTLILRPADGAPAFDDADGILVSIDSSVVPRWPPVAFDVLAFATPLLFTVVAKGPERWIVGVPGDLQVHVFGTLDGWPFGATVAPGQTEIPVAPWRGGRHLRGRPLVDGRPVPDGTVLAPGRLDLESVRRVANRWARGRGLSVVLHPGAPVDRHTLPVADALTAWHPSFGVAWLSWDDESIPSGTSCPGTLTIRAGRPGGTAMIRAILPRWTVSTGGEWPPPTEVTFDAEGLATVRGLPFGRYEVVTAAGPTERLLDETSPTAEVVLPPPR